jgi:hypothetical protein
MHGPANDDNKTALRGLLSHLCPQQAPPPGVGPREGGYCWAAAALLVTAPAPAPAMAAALLPWPSPVRGASRAWRASPRTGFRGTVLRPLHRRPHASPAPAAAGRPRAARPTSAPRPSRRRAAPRGGCLCRPCGRSKTSPSGRCGGLMLRGWSRRVAGKVVIVLASPGGWGACLQCGRASLAAEPRAGGPFRNRRRRGTAARARVS